MTLAGLALGDHQITLRAANSQQLTGEHTITVHVALDADGDGMTDAWESGHGLDPNDGSDAEGDLDADALPNWREFQLTTDPQAADTDRDSYTDDVEVSRGSDPTDAQSVPYDRAPDQASTAAPVTVVPTTPAAQATAAPSGGGSRSLATLAGLGACGLLGLLIVAGVGAFVLRRKR